MIPLQRKLAGLDTWHLVPLFGTLITLGVIPSLPHTTKLLIETDSKSRNEQPIQATNPVPSERQTQGPRTWMTNTFSQSSEENTLTLSYKWPRDLLSSVWGSAWVPKLQAAISWPLGERHYPRQRVGKKKSHQIFLVGSELLGPAWPKPCSSNLLDMWTNEFPLVFKPRP